MNQETLFPNGDMPPGLEAKFWVFHRDNPRVYRAVCRFADEAVRAGRTRLSIYMIFNRIRWYTMIETTGDEFKLNNNLQPFYARLWLRDHPGHVEFFQLRRQKREATI